MCRISATFRSQGAIFARIPCGDTGAINQRTFQGTGSINQRTALARDDRPHAPVGTDGGFCTRLTDHSVQSVRTICALRTCSYNHATCNTASIRGVKRGGRPAAVQAMECNVPLLVPKQALRMSPLPPTAQLLWQAAQSSHPLPLDHWPSGQFSRNSCTFLRTSSSDKSVLHTIRRSKAHPLTSPSASASKSCGLDVKRRSCNSEASIPVHVFGAM